MIIGSKQKNGTYDLNAFYSDFKDISNITPEMTKFARDKHILPMPEGSMILIVDDVGSGDTIIKKYKQQDNSWHDV